MGSPADAESSVWWRSRWLSAIYDSDLSPTQRFVATVYADFAGEGRTSWSAISTVMHRTGYSKDAVVRSRKVLVEKGWLIAVAKPSRHQAATYALMIPGVAEEDPSTDLGVIEEDTRGTGGRHPGVAEEDTSNPLEKNHQSSLTPGQEALRKALDCSPQDERLTIADDLLAANDVRFAPAWLKTAKQNGSLDKLIDDQLADKKLMTRSKIPEGWGPLPKSNETFWDRPYRATGNDGDNSWSAKKPRHPYEPDAEDKTHCTKCGLPEANRRHRGAA